MTEILGRDGETKQHMLEWFQRRGFWSTPDDQCFTVLNQLNALQLDILAGYVTRATLNSQS